VFRQEISSPPVGRLAGDSYTGDTADGAGKGAQEWVAGGGADGLEADAEEAIVALGGELF
jgi:hypothetical protein